MSQLDRVRSSITGYSGLPGVATQWFDPGEGLNPQDLVDRIRVFWLTISTNISSGVTVNVEPVVDSVDSETGLVTSSTGVTPPAPVVGLSNGDILPPMTQALVQLRTGVYFGGRELRGRTFIMGYTENDSSGGVPAAGIVSGLQSAAQDLADDADQVVYSPSKREYADVSTTIVWNKWAVLRSRRD